MPAYLSSNFWNSFLDKIIGVGLPFSPPGELPDLGIKPTSPRLPHYRQILYHWSTEEAILPFFIKSNSLICQVNYLKNKTIDILKIFVLFSI